MDRIGLWTVTPVESDLPDELRRLVCDCKLCREERAAEGFARLALAMVLAEETERIALAT